ncbi:hypothetical protein KIN20_020796 [Parelaphostrongylus tenuis]|uniref:Uncharacterized protein n=1 Tax=Parelaphostrongylus tenuis TaxID=148309 RepID=A0AAD5MRS7_PARTN|nr:hypothetical protein KIN20_020796 [Parelaphostrongylus tenuis]
MERHLAVQTIINASVVHHADRLRNSTTWHAKTTNGPEGLIHSRTDNIGSALYFTNERKVLTYVITEIPFFTPGHQRLDGLDK